MRPRKQSRDLIIGGKQLLVMQSIFRLKKDAFGGGIYGDLADQNNPTALPQIYSILEKLHKKGLVTFEFTLPSRRVGGRRRKVYTITGKGQKVMNASNIANAHKLADGGYVVPGLARRTPSR